LSSDSDKAVVRRYFEEICNAKKLHLASEVFTPDYLYHDPQIPGVAGPKAMIEVIRAYRDNVRGTWRVDEITTGENGRITVRWTGIGKHTGKIPGIPVEPSGNVVEVEAISVFRVQNGKIAEQWCIWDALTFLKQLGALPP
jgi:steroid delta-isomerase-like uncharacterized protein